MSHNGRFQSSTIGIKRSYTQFTAGTSGAVPALTACTRAKDLSSLVKPAGTGLYDLFLTLGWTALCGWQISVIQASYSKNGACKGEVTVDNVASATPKVRVTFYDGDGDAVDLASGDVVRVALDLKKTAGLA